MQDINQILELFGRVIIVHYFILITVNNQGHSYMLEQVVHPVLYQRTFLSDMRHQVLLSYNKIQSKCLIVE
jgi:hypothetical protein